MLIFYQYDFDRGYAYTTDCVSLRVNQIYTIYDLLQI